MDDSLSVGTVWRSSESLIRNSHTMAPFKTITQNRLKLLCVGILRRGTQSRVFKLDSMSEHTMTMGKEAAVAGVEARVIDKHVTLCRADDGVDWIFFDRPLGDGPTGGRIVAGLAGSGWGSLCTNSGWGSLADVSPQFVYCSGYEGWGGVDER